MRTIASQRSAGGGSGCCDEQAQNQFNENLPAIRDPILPTKLEQIKPLASLKPDEQRQVWDQAVATVDGKVPSGRIVQGIVNKLKDKPLVLAQDDCQVGDVFTLVRLDSQHKKYNGCWAIAKRCPQSGIAVEPRDSTVIVEVQDMTLSVKLDNLVKIDSPDVKRRLPQILQRITRLRAVGFLDRGADNVLEHVGRHTELTAVEEGLLSWLENYYRVDEQQSKS